MRRRTVDKNREMVQAKKMVVDTERSADQSEREQLDQPLSPAARVFQTPRFSCFILSLVGCKTAIKPDVVIRGLNQTFVKHPRFSSKLDYDKVGNPRWVRTELKAEDHVIVPDLDPEMEKPEQFIEDYVSELSTFPMDMTKPLWQLHILNVRTSEAEAVGVLKVHHSMGDGISLMSLVLACTRKTSDPESLPSLPTQKRHDGSSTRSRNGIFRLFLAAWLLLTKILNSLVDVLLFIATTLFLRDTETPVKGSPGVEHNQKRFAHRTLSLDDVKLVKNAMKMTINDVILGVAQAGLTRYLNRRYAEEVEKDPKANNLPNRIRLRAAILVNIRPNTNIEDLADMMAGKSKLKWGNWIGYVLLPFSIAQRSNPLDHLQQAKATMDRKKLSYEAALMHLANRFLVKTFGAETSATLVHRVLSNTTLSFSNLIGPSEEISFYGHPIAYMSPSVYGHPHALTMHFQSYMNKMTISMAVDPTVIPDPHQLCQDLEESLKSFKVAVLERGLLKNVS